MAPRKDCNSRIYLHSFFLPNDSGRSSESLVSPRLMSSTTKGISNCSILGVGTQRKLRHLVSSSCTCVQSQVLQAHQVFAKSKSPIIALFQRNSVFFTLIEVDLFYIYPLRSGKPGPNIIPSALFLSIPPLFHDGNGPCFLHPLCILILFLSLGQPSLSRSNS